MCCGLRPANICFFAIAQQVAFGLLQIPLEIIIGIDNLSGAIIALP